MAAPSAGLLIGISACAEPSDGEASEESTSPEVEPKRDSAIEKVYGDGQPEHISILCVDGSVFLYVYRGAGYGGGPSVERFPEQDETCSDGDEPAESSTQEEK